MTRVLLFMMGILTSAFNSSLAWAHEGHAHIVEKSLIDPTLLGFSGLTHITNVHPAFVHFPIALFPSALLLYGLGVILSRPSLIIAGRACLYLAAAAIVVTIVTGVHAQETFPHNPRVHHMMTTHLRIGLMIGGLAGVLTIWSFIHRNQQPLGIYGFLIVLAFTTYAVLQNGDLGSRMVYLEGAAVQAGHDMILQPHGDHHQETP